MLDIYFVHVFWSKLTHQYNFTGKGLMYMNIMQTMAHFLWNVNKLYRNCPFLGIIRIKAVAHYKQPASKNTKLLLPLNHPTLYNFSLLNSTEKDYFDLYSWTQRILIVSYVINKHLGKEVYQISCNM